MSESIQTLFDHLDRLGELGEDLRNAVSDGDRSGWLYSEIAQEAARVAEIAWTYVEEFDRARVYFARRTLDGDL